MQYTSHTMTTEQQDFANEIRAVEAFQKVRLAPNVADNSNPALDVRSDPFPPPMSSRSAARFPLPILPM